MSHMDNTMTETERDDAWHQDHPECEICNRPVAVVGEDGLELACNGSCDADQGTAVHDDHGIAGYVHDDCREHYITLAVRDYIRDGLLVRNGCEINQLTAAERANNLATGVVELIRSLGGVETNRKRG